MAFEAFDRARRLTERGFTAWWATTHKAEEMMRLLAAAAWTAKVDVDGAYSASHRAADATHADIQRSYDAAWSAATRHKPYDAFRGGDPAAVDAAVCDRYWANHPEAAARVRQIATAEQVAAWIGLTAPAGA